MIIKSLSASFFRNFEQVDIQFNERLNIIIGDNGQGKTNIIEALYLLTEGESFRYSKNENLIQLGQNASFIHTNILNEDLDYKLSMKLTSSKKDILINNKVTNINRLTRFSSVLFSPESLNIIKESSDERRQLVDQLVAQTALNGVDTIRDYRKVLKTRNRLLKDISEEKIDYRMGLDTLESLNPAFLRLAAELTYLRLQALEDIRPQVEMALNNIHSSTSVKFDFEYVFSDQNHRNSDLEKLLNFMQNRMSELQKAELKSGVSLVGPQKHDVIFLYNGNDSRFYCSQGQQRSIILAYKMAQIVYHQKVHGFYPLLLLDDVLSELDLSKQESLISTLNQTETQTFVTTTDVSLLSKLSMNKASVFKIKNGQVVI
ncbi:DNA replication/repair protein RecF [Pseudobdellovibrio exovorus]|uniref:DNA replication and repair protein RecF n=1 Tax=Pseudobdellovibrio exovorus JSS TaxID=1184267 RepID=M4V4X0_9BACT|nr:DNA replication and repair protein RecF [Pseudobdellovibrio exovorus]AGH94223.1 DNA repair and genetic recombination protein [Pseudobdellovibrio exovorus JSS]